jgi:hypothetical protein
VVDLPDGRVLAQDLAVAATQLADVAHQHQGAARLAGRHQRQDPQGDGGALRLDLALARLAEPERRRDGRRPARLVEDAGLGGQLGHRATQVHAEQVGRHPEPAEGGQAVGAGVDDVTGAVEADQAVADAGGVLGVGQRAGERERALGDHLQQLAGVVR